LSSGAGLVGHWRACDEWKNQVPGENESQVIKTGSQVRIENVPGVEGNNSHSIMAVVNLSDPHPESRQWMLVFGQADIGAHHWLYNPAQGGDGHIQFGAWSGRYSVKKLPLDAGEFAVLATTYDAEQAKYHVYVNGQLHDVLDNVRFRIMEPTLWLGHCIERPFTGLIHDVRLWDGVLSSEEVLTLAKSVQSYQPIGSWSSKSDWRNTGTHSEAKTEVVPSGLTVSNCGFSGSGSHSVIAVCEFLKNSPDAREWILNVGQQGAGAHHWLYDPNNAAEPIKFGAWNGKQATKALSVKGNTVVICTVYRAETQTYEVFINGALHEKVEGMTFDITSSNLYVGHCIENSFSGNVREMQLWDKALNSNEIADATRYLTVKFKLVAHTSEPVLIGSWKREDQWVNKAGGATGSDSVEVSGERVTIKDFPLSGNASHTLFVKCTLSNPDPPSREWILNLGQVGQYAHHWLYNPLQGGDGYIQFGAWSGVYATRKLIQGAGAEASILSTYNAQSGVYKLFVNGRLHQQLEGAKFDFQTPVLRLGYCIERDFSGKLQEVQLWNGALSDNTALEMTTIQGVETDLRVDVLPPLPMPVPVGIWRKSLKWKNLIEESKSSSSRTHFGGKVTIKDFGISGNSSHTIIAACKLSDPHPDSREWILTIGQFGSGAHHWLYNPVQRGDGYIQFGCWNGAYATKRIDLPAGALAVLCTVYDSQEHIYRVYVNGCLHEELYNVQFNITESTAYVGHGLEKPFSGAIHELAAWTSALREDQVKALSTFMYGKLGYVGQEIPCAPLGIWGINSDWNNDVLNARFGIESNATADGLKISKVGISGNQPHSIMMICKLPEVDPPSREWMLNLGQTGYRAHHWLYNPVQGGDGHIQFGSWGVFPQCQNKLDFPAGAQLSICTTFDGSGNYKLYLNGQLHDQNHMLFNVEEPTLWVSHCIERAFTGYIYEIVLWEGALPQSDVIIVSNYEMANYGGHCCPCKGKGEYSTIKYVCKGCKAEVAGQPAQHSCPEIDFCMKCSLTEEKGATSPASPKAKKKVAKSTNKEYLGGALHIDLRLLDSDDALPIIKNMLECEDLGELSLNSEDDVKLIVGFLNAIVKQCDFKDNSPISRYAASAATVWLFTQMSFFPDNGGFCTKIMKELNAISQQQEAETKEDPFPQRASVTVPKIDAKLVQEKFPLHDSMDVSEKILSYIAIANQHADSYLKCLQRIDLDAEVNVKSYARAWVKIQNELDDQPERVLDYLRGRVIVSSDNLQQNIDKTLEAFSKFAEIKRIKNRLVKEPSVLLINLQLKDTNFIVEVQIQVSDGGNPDEAAEHAEAHQHHHVMYELARSAKYVGDLNKDKHKVMKIFQDMLMPRVNISSPQYKPLQVTNMNVKLHDDLNGNFDMLYTIKKRQLKDTYHLKTYADGAKRFLKIN
jgi:hypothetical protein